MPVRTIEQALANEARRIVAQSGPVFSRPGKQGDIGPQGVNDGLVNLRQKGATGGSALLDTAGLTAALADAVAQGNGVQVPSSAGAGPYVLDADFAPVSPFVFAPGARLYINAGKNFQPTEPLDGDGWLFDGPGAVSLRWRAASRVTPLMFGAKADQVNDDAPALQRMLDSVAAVQASGIGFQMPRCDLLGLSYLLGAQVEVPGGQGIAVECGRLLAGPAFPLASFLLHVGRVGDADLPDGFKANNPEFRGIYFDNRHRGGGLQIERTNRSRVTDCTFVGYSTFGFQLTSAGVGGHECFARGLQCAEYVWGDMSSTGYQDVANFVGTGIDINTPDNHVVDCVVALSKVGLRVNSQANHIARVHTWTGYVKTAGTSGALQTLDVVTVGVRITALATLCSFSQMYIDGCEVRWEDPWKTKWHGGMFLHGAGDFNRAFIYFEPKAAGRSVNGVIISGVTFQVNGGGSIAGLKVDTSSGTINNGQVTNTHFRDNTWTSVTPFYSTWKGNLSQNGATAWAFDMTAHFPIGVPQQVIFTAYQFGGGTRDMRLSNIAGQVVTVSAYDPAIPANLSATNANVFAEISINLTN